FRFFLIGAAVAIILAVAVVFALREVNESSTSGVRRNMILFIAQDMEAGPSYQEAIETLRHRSRRRIFGTGLWVFSEQGDLLATNSESVLPVRWNELHKPLETHEITYHYEFLRLIPDSALVKLDSTPTAYLLVEF